MACLGVGLYTLLHPDVRRRRALEVVRAPDTSGEEKPVVSA
jgi:hypothetical protein